MPSNRMVISKEECCHGIFVLLSRHFSYVLFVPAATNLQITERYGD